MAHEFESSHNIFSLAPVPRDTDENKDLLKVLEESVAIVTRDMKRCGIEHDFNFPLIIVLMDQSVIKTVHGKALETIRNHRENPYEFTASFDFLNYYISLSKEFVSDAIHLFKEKGNTDPLIEILMAIKEEAWH